VPAISVTSTSPTAGAVAGARSAVLRTELRGGASAE